MDNGNEDNDIRYPSLYIIIPLLRFQWWNYNENVQTTGIEPL